MVRAPGQDPDYLKRILDAGAEAIMVPMEETAEQARAVVAACKYPQAGRRAYSAPTVRAPGNGADPNSDSRAHYRLFTTLPIYTTTASNLAVTLSRKWRHDNVSIGPSDQHTAICSATS